VDVSTSASAKLWLTTASDVGWGAMAAPFCKTGGSRSESHTRSILKQMK
jgi:hypothetical protein